jgi:hypothetical protein
VSESGALLLDEWSFVRPCDAVLHQAAGRGFGRSFREGRGSHHLGARHHRGRGFVVIFHGMSIEPECSRYRHRIDRHLAPPSAFVTVTVELAMVPAAEWDGTLVADPAPERAYCVTIGLCRRNGGVRDGARGRVGRSARR